MSIAHRSFFLLVAGSKTIVSIGQACLTVDATVLALSALAQYHRESITESNDTKALSIIFQSTAAIFSVLMIMLTRYPAIWDKLKWHGLYRQTTVLRESMSNTSRSIKAVLLVIGIFGLLSCVARGMSAYLGVEVVLGERAKLDQFVVGLLGWFVGVTVMVSAMCFNLSNMLTSATHYLKNPSISFRPSVLFSMIAAISSAVAMRFFIMHFLMRREANVSEQILGQGVFGVAEFFLGCFTMVSSFEPKWKKNAKKVMCHSALLTTLFVGDALTAWLGYHTISWYSILSDSFLAENSLQHRNETDFVLRWTFISAACLIGIPTTLSYIHYLLDYAKKGYNRAIDLLPDSYYHYRFRVFEPSPTFGWTHNLPPKDYEGDAAFLPFYE